MKSGDVFFCKEPYPSENHPLRFDGWKMIHFLLTWSIFRDIRSFSGGLKPMDDGQNGSGGFGAEMAGCASRASMDQ